MSRLIGFYLWVVFPPIGHSAILHLETTGLIEIGTLDLHFIHDIGMY